MNRKWKFATLVATVAAVLAGPSFARAEELHYTALLSRIQALEAELASQQTDFVSYGMGGDKGKGDKGCELICDMQPPAWYFQYELTVLRPYISDGGSQLLGQQYDNKYGTGHRFTLGYDGGAGMGVRARYWGFFHGHDLEPGPGTVDIDMDVFDLEVTLRERLRNWDLLVAGGFRYGRASTELGGTGDVYFEGTGPTVALEATREVGRRNFYIVGNVRTAALFGEIRDQTGIALPFAEYEDEVMLNLENQLGFGWLGELGCADLNLRAVWESQLWYNAALGDDILGFGSNVGFGGPTFSAELRY